MEQASSSTPFQLGTFSKGDHLPFVGLVVKNRAVALSAVTHFLERAGLELSATNSLLAVLEQWPKNIPILHCVAAELAAGSEGELDEHATSVESLKFFPPINLPRQVFCAGANYRQHVIELILGQSDSQNERLSLKQRRESAEAHRAFRRGAG